MPAKPLIVYIPGLKPKPEPHLHIEQLGRCLQSSVRRASASVADEIVAADAFELVAWTHDFYGEYRDIGQDLDDISAMLEKRDASEADIIVATSLRRRFAIWLFHIADYLPFVLPKLATEEIEVHLRDFFRYVGDNHGVAEAAREKLKSVLRQAHDDGRPVLLLAHSMGSVISFDALWQLSRVEDSDAGIDLFLTTGSPLGQKIVQRNLLGAKSVGIDRYPGNIRNWVNIAAVGELTAIDRTLRNDYAAMLKLNLVESITDREVFNYFRMQGALNVHAEYGYLANEVTGRCVADWWRSRT